MKIGVTSRNLSLRAISAAHALPKERPSMPRMRLTQAAVDRISSPAVRTDFWDTTLPGFGLRVAPSGRKTWIAFYRVRGRVVRESFGTTATIPRVDDAR